MKNKVILIILLLFLTTEGINATEYGNSINMYFNNVSSIEELIIGNEYNGFVNKSTSHLFHFKIPSDGRIYFANLRRMDESSLNISFYNVNKDKIASEVFSIVAKSSDGRYDYLDFEKGDYYMYLSGYNARYVFTMGFAPSVPSNFCMTDVSENTMTFKWEKVEGVDGYEIGGTLNNAIVSGCNNTSYIVKNLLSNHSYYFHVKSYVYINNKKFVSLDSKNIAGCTTFEKPIIKKIVSGTKKFTVKWKIQWGLAGKMEIQYSPSKSMKSAKIIRTSNTGGSRTVKNLKSGKKYYVRLRVVNGQVYEGNPPGISKWSRKVSVKVK